MPLASKTQAQRTRYDEGSEAKLAPLGRRVYTDRFYSGVSRYTTSGFLRIKLGDALENRGVALHIFESADEAKSDADKESGPR
ncbi:MAG TPA: hypothetical protein VKS24_15585 [Bradyrhizobium sp.]|nr:hypothetical protein [Bradyrhizobium sp.]